MMAEAPTVALDDLVELQGEKISANKDPRWPYIGLEHIAQGEPRLLGVSDSASSVSVNSVFRKNDILFGKLRPNLRKSIGAPFDGYCSTDILVLRSRDGILPSFSGHVFQWERVFAAAVATAAGTKMPRTAWRDLRSFRVFNPSDEAEQSRIAYVLDTIDEAIQKTEAVIAKLKRIRAGMLHDLLTYGLDKDGELRDPVAHPEQFKDSELGRIPKEWEVVSLDDLGRWAGGKTPSKADPAFWKSGTTPWVTPKDVKQRIITDTEDRLTDLGASIMELFPVGALVVVGRSGILRHTLPVAVCSRPFTVNQDLKVLVPPSGNKTTAAFLLLVLEQKDEEIRQRTVKTGTTVESIDWAAFKRVRVAWPKEDEREAILTTADRIDKNIMLYVAERAKLRQLKSGLMDDLLGGKVPVPEDLLPEEVPA